MPDANKLEAYQQQEVRCARTCAVCSHGSFRPATMWGICDRATYTHQKHTGGELPLPVHLTMTCPGFELGVGSRQAAASLGEYSKLLPGLVDG